jgi:hypothetical protein
MEEILPRKLHNAKEFEKNFPNTFNDKKQYHKSDIDGINNVIQQILIKYRESLNLSMIYWTEVENAGDHA